MFIVSLFFLITLSGNGGVTTIFQNAESAKIEFLLKEVEKLQGAKFWRNGSSYSAQAAADHLRMKWTKAGSAVKTVKDFIDKIGSQSSVSGRAYQIEFADGKKVNTSAFFYQKLAGWKP
jgi:hypothetical protein